MPTPRLTLDTNCLINLENRTSQHKSVRALIDAHRAGKLVACVPAIAASENQPGGMRRTNYKEFQAWLEQLDAADLKEVPPMGYWGIMFWGHGVWSSERARQVERAIHDVLHPRITFEYADYCAEHDLDPAAKPTDRRWLNAKCDVQAMWSHIHAENNAFITEDRRFLRSERRTRLFALGADNIMTPDEAARTFVDESSG